MTTPRNLPDIWRGYEPTNHGDEFQLGIAKGKDDCADELEAALAIEWEAKAVAHVYETMDGKRHALWEQGCEKLPEGSPLYTHPAPVAVGVDDAMVERAAKEICARNGGDYDWRDEMQAAKAILSAALEADR